MYEKTQKLYEEVAGKLQEEIRTGTYQPGDRLPSERILSQEYGVSRSVIREAFRSLEQMGCVEARTGGGTYVKAPEISSMVDSMSMLISLAESFAMELVEARLVVETEIARLAAERRTEEQIVMMHKTLDEMRREVYAGGKGIEQDSKFHGQLAEAAGNRVLQMMSSSCAEVLNRSMEVTQAIEGVPKLALLAHEGILYQVEKQDGGKAEACMRKHLMSADENLRRVFADNTKVL